ncbi:TPA: NAD-dependent epimerase/dehydratase family protein [Vibrio vulnificus]|nr:NAD-dependent epimerase/dehydratase family protein [Vibrio vulnificus]
MKKNTKRKVLILGGTGIIGQNVSEEYLKNGYEVVVTTRSNRKSTRKGLSYLYVNARDLDMMRSLLYAQNFDVIVDLMVYTVREFEGIINFLLNLSKHYIFVSSYRIYADSPTPLVESSSRLIDTISDKDFLESGDYALVKTEQEAILSNLDRDHWTIVRPGITYGGNRFQLGTFEASVITTRSMLGLEVPIPSELLNTRCTLTSAKDVGFLIYALSGNKGAFRDDFNVMTSESVSWSDVSRIYSRVLNTRITPVELSKFYEISENLWHLTYDRLYNRECSNEKIKSFLGIEDYQFVPILEGLESTLRDYKNTGCAFEYTQNRTEGKIDRVLGNFQFGIVGKGGYVGYLKYVMGRVKIFDRIKKRM